MAERPSGYYWVRNSGKLSEPAQIAEWITPTREWFLAGSHARFPETWLDPLFGPIPGPEELAAMGKIRAEILEIGESYKRGDSTPGGMEHLGDVRRIFTRWEKALLADAAIAQAAPEQEKP